MTYIKKTYEERLAVRERRRTNALFVAHIKHDINKAKTDISFCTMFGKRKAKI